MYRPHGPADVAASAPGSSLEVGRLAPPGPVGRLEAVLWAFEAVTPGDVAGPETAAAAALLEAIRRRAEWTRRGLYRAPGAPVEVELTPWECWLAEEAAKARNAHAAATGAVPKAGQHAAATGRDHTTGAGGELTTAIWRDVYWTGTPGTLDGTRREIDVDGYQVRTRSRHEYELYADKTDPDDAVYILVTGTAPRFVIRGWAPGREIKTRGPWRELQKGRWAHCLPHQLLRPLATLPVIRRPRRGRAPG